MLAILADLLMDWGWRVPGGDWVRALIVRHSRGEPLERRLEAYVLPLAQGRSSILEPLTGSIFSWILKLPRFYP